jgi:hypothetical protein
VIAGRASPSCRQAGGLDVERPRPGADQLDAVQQDRDAGNLELDFGKRHVRPASTRCTCSTVSRTGMVSGKAPQQTVGHAATASSADRPEPRQRVDVLADAGQHPNSAHLRLDRLALDGFRSCDLSIAGKADDLIALCIYGTPRVAGRAPKSERSRQRSRL